jgi:hypothetical protein
LPTRPAPGATGRIDADGVLGTLLQRSPLVGLQHDGLDPPGIGSRRESALCVLKVGDDLAAPVVGEPQRLFTRVVVAYDEHAQHGVAVEQVLMHLINAWLLLPLRPH